MTLFMNIWLAFWTVILGMSLTLLFRNNAVLRYRMRVLTKVSEAARIDILQGREWEWRYEVLKSVSYDEMVLKFWRKLDSFYQNKTFMTLDKTKQAQK